jgi:hypothetical protein
MTGEEFIALADALRIHNRTADGRTEFTPDHFRVLAEFFASRDSNFNREQWIDYAIKGDMERDTRDGRERPAMTRHKSARSS